MEEQRDRFCRMAFQPWVWVLALMVFALSIWAIMASGNTDGEDLLELQRQAQNTQQAGSQATGITAAGRFMAMQQAQTPLPAGARQSIKAPHAERGVCHSCHPYAGQAPAGQMPATRNQVQPAAFQLAAAQQAFTPLPIGARRYITPSHAERGTCHSCHPYTSTNALPGSPLTVAAAQVQSPQPAPRTYVPQQNFVPYQGGAPVLGIVPGAETRVKTSRFLFPCWRRGVMVRQVYPGSFAHANGVQQGDVITRFNRRKIKNAEHFQGLLTNLRPGTPVSMRLYRDGRCINISRVN